MHQEQLIEKTARFVQHTLAGAEGGHDWWHILRVWNNAKLIAKDESVDQLVVELGALLHDIADSKFHDGDETIGPRLATEFLQSEGVDAQVIDHVVAIIENISFKGGKHERTFDSLELRVCMDADRLDALGAIGIARAFTYGGHKGREMYNPNVPPKLGMTKEEYKTNIGHTVNHFYEKLLLLKDSMHTDTGKQIAQDRHVFMQTYLEEFFAEWEGER